MEVQFERPGQQARIRHFDAVPSPGETVFIDGTVYDIDDVTWDLTQDVVVVDLSP